MIQNYIVDKLTLSDLKENGKVVIPNFQRGVVWTKAHRKEFIETVKSGDPFGVVLVYQENPGCPYYLIDGLQRLSTLKAYMANPLEYIDENDRFINQELLDDLFQAKYNSLGIKLPGTTKLDKEKKKFLKRFISHLKSMDKMSSDTDLWENIVAQELEVDVNKFEVYKKFSDFYKSFSSNLELPDIIIHAIVYQGKRERLPVVFETLNTSSVSLTKYEVFSSQWPDFKMIINDDELVNCVWSKYENLKKSSSFEVDVTIDAIRESGMTLFEYCFGFSELVCDSGKDYSFLFTKEKKSTDPTGFELLSLACGLAVNKADVLWKDEYLGKSSPMLLIQLKDALIDSIKIVSNALSSWIKDLNDSYIKSVGAYQIYYMIINVFNHKYEFNSNTKSLSEKEDYHAWITNFNKYAYKWYIYHILSGFWNQNRQVSDLRRLLDDSESNNEMYFTNISKQTWSDVLQKYFKDSNNDSYSRTIPTEVRLFLNYYYRLLLKEDANRNQYFTKTTDAGEEIGFDIEHVVPYSKFKNFVDIPMTVLGNLCYLPVKDNRSKRDHTIYEYALDRPSLTFNSEFLSMIDYPTREELSFIDCPKNQFEQPFNQLVDQRSEKMVNKFISLII